MAEAMTRAGEASVDEPIASRAAEDQRAVCKLLVEIMARVTGQPPKRWGASIVGFGA
jgi:hypothetical protein